MAQDGAAPAAAIVIDDDAPAGGTEATPWDAADVERQTILALAGELAATDDGALANVLTGAPTAAGIETVGATYVKVGMMLENKATMSDKRQKLAVSDAAALTARAGEARAGSELAAAQGGRLVAESALAKQKLDAEEAERNRAALEAAHKATSTESRQTKLAAANSSDVRALTTVAPVPGKAAGEASFGDQFGAAVTAAVAGGARFFAPNGADGHFEVDAAGDFFESLATILEDKKGSGIFEAFAAEGTQVSLKFKDGKELKIHKQKKTTPHTPTDKMLLLDYLKGK